MKRVALLVMILLVIGGGIFFIVRHVPRASGQMARQAYVLRPMWSEAMYKYLGDHGPAFDEVVVSGGEIATSPEGPQYFLSPIDYAWLAKQGWRVGLMVEVGRLGAGADPTLALTSCVHSILEKSAAAGLHPVELIVDDPSWPDWINGMNSWVLVNKSSIPISVTALPGWVELGSFKTLAKLTGSFVLREDFSGVGDVNAMRADVERAARVGVPFRVALPALNRAEQGGSVVDPTQLAGLMRDWSADRPAVLRGIVWNNLSSDDDLLAWRWLTLDAVMTGTPPAADVQLQVRRLEATVSEIDVVNKGSADAPFDSPVSVTWTDADLVESQALGDFDRTDTGRRSMMFTPQSSLAKKPIRAGEQRAIGWVRLTDDSVVKAAEAK